MNNFHNSFNFEVNPDILNLAKNILTESEIEKAVSLVPQIANEASNCAGFVSSSKNPYNLAKGLKDPQNLLEKAPKGSRP